MTAGVAQPPRQPYRLRRAVALLRYERIKALSLRSTRITIGALFVVLLIAGIDGLHAALRSTTRASVDPVYDVTDLVVAQYAAALLGVLAIAGEYATGAIRSTALAAPRRVHAYAAKAAVVAFLAFAVGSVYALLDLTVIRPALGHHAATIPTFTLARAVVGIGLYLALITMLAVGVCAALRYTAGALAILGVLLFLADQFTSYRYLPAAGTDFVRTVHRAGDSPWAGLGILTAWTATSLTVGAITLRRREL